MAYFRLDPAEWVFASYKETSAKLRLNLGLVKFKLKKSLKRHKFVENVVCQCFPYPCFPLYLTQLDTIIPGVRYKL